MIIVSFLGEIDRILSDSVVDQSQNVRVERLKDAIGKITEDFKLNGDWLATTYPMWINQLEQQRLHCRFLQLLSNRQIMILMILLTKSSDNDRIKHGFLKKIYGVNRVTFQENEEPQLIIRCLIHYLRSFRMFKCELSEVHVQRVYDTSRIDCKSNPKERLKNLGRFLETLFHGEKLPRNIRSTVENQQYLVTLNRKNHIQDVSSFKHDFDIETCCILMHIFENQLPSAFQILWCTMATEDDIRLFFSRIRTFHSLSFAIIDMDQMQHRLRELILNEQDKLTRQDGTHACVYYFSREITCRKGLRPFIVTSQHRRVQSAASNISTLIRQNDWIKSRIEIVCGISGIGMFIDMLLFVVR
jgi:hypothetical protein